VVAKNAQMWAFIERDQASCAEDRLFAITSAEPRDGLIGGTVRIRV
jgi:hypothetical protein